MPKHRTIHESKPVVGELTEGDGVDPREEKKNLRRRETSGKPNYAILRLASQIRDALDLVIPQVEDPHLASFVVGTVEPSASGKTFVVQVYSTDSAADYSPRAIKAILDDMKPRFRAEVAKEVSRKNAPDFKFDVLPPKVHPK